MKNAVLASLTATMILILMSACNENPAPSRDLISYVDPFIGTDFHGHTFPGATTPFGMVQLSPDTRVRGWDACSGYHYSDSSVMGFSHTHFSGTGMGDLADVLLMPYTGEVTIVPGTDENPGSGYRSRFRKKTEKASPGYYSVYLDDYDIQAELSATPRTGIHRYTFPDAGQAGILIDLYHSVYEHRNIINRIHVISDQEIEGLKKSSGWARNHYVYFRAYFSKPFEIELFNDNEPTMEQKELEGTNVKAKLRFKTEAGEQVIVKIGISAVDYEGASKNLEKELMDLEFEEVVDKAREAWNMEMNRIQVSDNDEARLRTFYTALYHSSIAPNIFSDVDGRYRGMDQQIHHSNDPTYTIYSLWDTYRAQHPLFTIIRPQFNQELIRDLLRKYDDGGILPMWALASNYTGTMIGSHAVSVIVDSYMKGLDDFDTEKALEAIVHAITYDTVKEIHYPENVVPLELMPKAKLFIDTYGFVPSDLENESVAKALEFAYNYWGIAIMAEQLGEADLAKAFYDKSRTYSQYFDPESGFMRGKLSTGGWREPFDPQQSTHRQDDYVEGNAWQWTWFVPHDVEGLIDLFGSKEAFATKLDSFFTMSSEITGETASVDISGMIGQYAHGNEPSHHIAYLFNYVDQPWRTQEIVHQITTELYHDGPDGLCGNEDCGQMSAWYIMNAMGFYPVAPGDTRYSIGKPLHSEIRIKQDDEKEFVLTALNLSPENIYVQEVKLDGVRLKEPFIDHADIVAGKHLEFVMGNKPVVFWD